MNCSSVKKNSIIVFVTNSHSKVGNEINACLILD